MTSTSKWGGDEVASGTDRREVVGQEAVDLFWPEPREGPPTPDTGKASGVRIIFLKTKQGKTVPDIFILRRTPEESQIVDDMVQWLCASGTKEDDQFLTRYGVGPTGRGGRKRRVVRPSDCAAAVKLGAKKANLPTHHFSTSSCRKATVTSMDADGVEKDVIHKRTGHSNKSRVSDQHYNFSKSSSCGGRGLSVGPSAVTQEHQFQVEDLRMLVPAEVSGGEGTTTDPRNKRAKRDTKPPGRLSYDRLANPAYRS